MNSYSMIYLFLGVSLLSGTEGEICQTEACGKLASDLKVMMDTSVDPCDDFSSYICGNMANLHPIPPGKSVYNSFSKINDYVRNILKGLLENQSLTNPLIPQTKVAIFYKSCLNMTERNKVSEIKILQFAENFKAENIQDILKDLISSGMTTRFLAFGYNQDPTNPKVLILHIDKPSLILGEGTLQTHELVDSKKKIASYVKYMNSILDHLNLWPNDRSIINEIVNLHIRLAKVFPSIADQNNPEKSINKLTIKDLQDKCSNISWITLINGVMEGSGMYFNLTDTVSVFSLDYIDILCQIFQEINTNPSMKKIFQFDIAWASISSLIPYGSDSLIGHLELLEREIYNTTGKEELINKCVDSTSDIIGEIVGSMFVKAVSASQKRNVELLISNLRLTFERVLATTSWMDHETRQKALVKLKKITQKIAYPDKLLSNKYLSDKYGKIIMTTDRFLDNIINYKMFSFVESMKLLKEPIRPDFWLMTPQEVNAYYSSNSNEIVFPLAILQYPFYNENLPLTYNYGSMGSIISHEILHAFDTSGYKFDENGHMRQWWTNSSIVNYLQKTRCILEQYGNYSIYNRSLPAAQTLEEDIADNSGFRLSYITASSSSSKQENLTLPGLNFTTDQIIFVAYANIYCNVRTRSDLLLDMESNVHSVWKYRINGPLSNMPEFSKVFHCDRNKTMNSSNKCLVW